MDYKTIRKKTFLKDKLEKGGRLLEIGKGRRNRRRDSYNATSLQKERKEEESKFHYLQKNCLIQTQDRLIGNFLTNI